MDRITRSLPPVLLLVGAAFLFTAGSAFIVGANAAWTPGSGEAADLHRAGQWLDVAAAAVVLWAVCTTGWEHVMDRAWPGAAEAGAAAAGAFLVTIGLLIGAAATEQPSAAAHVVAAVGIALWAGLALARAGRLSLAQDGPAADGTAANGAAGSAVAARARPSRQPALWLLTSGGLVVLAVGWGFTPDLTSKGIGITAGVLLGAGFACLWLALLLGRADGYLRSRGTIGAIAALALLTAAAAAFAVVAGADFGQAALAAGTVTSLRAGLSVTAAIVLAAAIVLGLAAWTRVRELVREGRAAHDGMTRPGPAA